MNKETHLKKARLMRAAFFHLIGNKEIVLTFERQDYESGFAQFLFEQLGAVRELRFEENDGLKTLFFGFAENQKRPTD